MSDLSRLESIESAAWRDLLEAAPPSERTRRGLWAETIGRATLIGAAGIDHPLFNRVIGLSGSEGDVVAERVVESYRRAGVKRYFVHVPEGTSGDALAHALERQGLTRFHRAWIKLVRDAEPPRHVETELDIVRANITHRAEIGEILTSAFELPESAAFTMTSVVGRRDWHVYIARDGARIAAVGGVFVRGSAASVAFAATRPEYRRRGAQSALLAKRIRVAIDLGCDLMTSETGEAVPFEAQHSFDNMRRHGFRPAYRRENFCPVGVRWGSTVS